MQHWTAIRAIPGSTYANHTHKKNSSYKRIQEWNVASTEHTNDERSVCSAYKETAAHTTHTKMESGSYTTDKVGTQYIRCIQKERRSYSAYKKWHVDHTAHIKEDRTVVHTAHTEEKCSSYSVFKEDLIQRIQKRNVAHTSHTKIEPWHITTQYNKKAKTLSRACHVAARWAQEIAACVNHIVRRRTTKKNAWMHFEAQEGYFWHMLR